MTNEPKQTAVDLFIKKLEEKAIEETEGLNQIHIVIDVNEYLELKEQTKEREKQQIIEDFVGYDSDTEDNLEVAEQYYNETYGGNK
jgi:hypothetical protein